MRHSPARGLTLTRGGAARPARVESADREAGHVRGQRRRRWLRQNNPLLAAVEKRAAGEGAVVVAVCAAIEAEVAQLEEADRAEFLAELGLEEPGWIA